MIQRCTNPNAGNYSRYGAKGVTVCDAWIGNFQQFLADMGERPEGKTLDRIDGTKGYTPENCRWATPAEQMDNVRNATWVTFRGERMTLSELSRRTGVRKATLKYRISQGWPDDALASEPSHSARSF